MKNFVVLDTCARILLCVHLGLWWHDENKSLQGEINAQLCFICRVESHVQVTRMPSTH